jgi:HrpA-like RNA helicase
VLVCPKTKQINKNTQEEYYVFAFSITIDDVVYVIDCGQTKITGFTPENDLATLHNVLVSHANSKQRRGRAGR